MPLPPSIPPVQIEQIQEQNKALTEASQGIRDAYNAFATIYGNTRLNPALRQKQLRENLDRFNRYVEAYNRAWAGIVASIGECVHQNLHFRDLLQQAEADLQKRIDAVSIMEASYRQHLADSLQEMTREQKYSGPFFTHIREAWAVLTKGSV